MKSRRTAGGDDDDDDDRDGAEEEESSENRTENTSLGSAPLAFDLLVRLLFPSRFQPVPAAAETIAAKSDSNAIIIIIYKFIYRQKGLSPSRRSDEPTSLHQHIGHTSTRTRILRTPIQN